jgi:hypothetical protein
MTAYRHEKNVDIANRAVHAAAAKAFASNYAARVETDAAETAAAAAPYRAKGPQRCHHLKRGRAAVKRGD